MGHRVRLGPQHVPCQLATPGRSQLRWCPSEPRPESTDTAEVLTAGSSRALSALRTESLYGELGTCSGHHRSGNCVGVGEVIPGHLAHRLVCRRRFDCAR